MFAGTDTIPVAISLPNPKVFLKKLATPEKVFLIPSLTVFMILKTGSFAS